jgi:hypothetical protein
MARRRRGAVEVRRRRAVALGILVALLLLAFGGGYLLATSGDGGSLASGSATPIPTRTHAPSPSSSASQTPGETPSTSPSASPVLVDGRSFVYAKEMGGTASAPTLAFDLALFLTDQAAIDAAAAHGDETPPPNGYYIVNDNPKLRSLPVAPTVTILYYPSGGPACCKHQTGTLDGFTAAVNGVAMTDYPDMSYTPWWLTVVNGMIVKITQQYLP